MPPSEKKTLRDLSKSYESLKTQAGKDAKSTVTAEILQRLTMTALKYLSSSCKRIGLTSKVPGKRYFSFTTIGKVDSLSRPVNDDLFDLNCANQFQHLLDGTISDLSFGDRSRFLYTLAISYCCASDLLRTRDQKTPATFFECLNGHLFARIFSVNPRTQIEVLRLEEEGTTLPTDFIFDLGSGKPKFHVPVKTSTRERVIQVFAHQRVLDGVHGFGKFKGILVSLTETKLDHKRKEVVEICIPHQWNLYQRFIAPMHRFYYFDIPQKYAELSKGDPPMAVLPFAKFFEEARDLEMGR